MAVVPVESDGAFEKKRAPEPGEWLDAFDEPGQTLLEYQQSRPVHAGPGDSLAFMPVGPFASDERAVFDRTVAFAGIWFQLPVSVTRPQPLPRHGWQRKRAWGTQYHTEFFLRKLLPENMPPDAVCVFAVTMGDLYPQDDWNFVMPDLPEEARVEPRLRHREALREAARVLREGGPPGRSRVDGREAAGHRGRLTRSPTRARRRPGRRRSR